ncbi:MAG: tetratricopeptide repeat-containing sulfotransferase family protein [Stenotrophomonas sp.]
MTNSVPLSPARPDPAQLLQELAAGNDLLRQGRIDQAIAHGERLVSAFPASARAHAFSAEACRLKGDLTKALSWIDQAIELEGDPQHRIKKAWLLSRLLRRDEIPALAEAIAADVGDNGLVLWQLGKLYYHHNLLSDAIGMYERALAVAGDNPAWRYDLGIARFYSGRFEDAEHDLDKVLATSPQSGSVIYLRSTLRKQRPENNHVADLQARLGQGFARAEDEAGALYALAKELEDLGEHERSIDALLAGARKKRSSITYDMSGFRTLMDEIRTAQSAEALSAPSVGCEETGAIFIVGMPRTGTTLAERILLQSGKVKNAGELLDFGFQLTSALDQVQKQNPSLSSAEATMSVDFAALGREYMRAARQMAGGSDVFIDKLPANYMYCGMIRKALPNARIIHLVRDPLDSCYAVLKTLFFSAYDFSYDLEELGDYYVLYRQMMAHWHEAMPGAILDVNYEDLVTDTEAQARRIYAWCGLEWTDDALRVPDKEKVFATASAAQVRQPVHTRSIHSSRKHAARLAPLVERLTAGGIFKL